VSVWLEIAARYFSAGENEALRSLAGDEAREAFFLGWTRKEAYSKALGEGISQRWTQFTVPLQPGAVAAPVEGRFTPGPCQSQLPRGAEGVDARFRGHDKARLGVVTPAQCLPSRKRGWGVHLFQTQPQDSDEALRFTLYALAPGPAYVGAVAAEGVGWRLSCWQWSG
jgi:hypothetical protein